MRPQKKKTEGEGTNRESGEEEDTEDVGGDRDEREIWEVSQVLVFLIKGRFFFPESWRPQKICLSYTRLPSQHRSK
jgi:hypothetical protein